MLALLLIGLLLLFWSAVFMPDLANSFRFYRNWRGGRWRKTVKGKWIQLAADEAHYSESDYWANNKNQLRKKS